MSGRPVHLLTAAIAAAASLLSASAASASCYSGCGGYAAPVAHYSAPVVYSYSYAAPMAYASPCGNPCGSYGHASYGYQSAPMYVVNQGPSYNAPVTGEAEGMYDTGYRRSYPSYGEYGYGYRRSYGGYRNYGYRSLRYGHRNWGYRGLRYGYRNWGHQGFRHGWRARQPMVGPGGIWRGPRYRTGLVVPKQWGGAIPPRHWNAAVRPHQMGGGQMHIMRQPGAVHPRMGGGAPKKLP